MQIYHKKSECSGCGACVQVCPANCISMKGDQEGFLYPDVNETECIRCGKCGRVCAAVGQQYPALVERAYAARNKEEAVRMKSSSGGVFGALAHYALQIGGKVYGAVYDRSLRIRHTAASNFRDLEAMYGSKYAQSDLYSVFRTARKDLEAGVYVLFTGTPCQIAGLRRFLEQDYDNLLCAAVICHGVNSPEILAEYIRFQEYVHRKKLVGIRFRDKSFHGWLKAGDVRYEYEDGLKEFVHASDDIFFEGFQKNLYLRPSCYQCRVKEGGIHFGADIILGDFWGIEKTGSRLYDNKGTSAVIVCSEKGAAAFERISAQLETESVELAQVLRGNSCLIRSVRANEKRERFFSELADTGSIERSILDQIGTISNPREGDKYHYQIALQYLSNQIHGKDLCNFFAENKYRKIALYALTDFTKLLLEDMRGNTRGIEVVYLSDLHAENYASGYQGVRVENIQKLVEDCRSGALDCVVIGYPAFENKIMNDLIRRGCPQEKLLSIGSAVFGVGG